MVPITTHRHALDTVIPPMFDPEDFTFSAEKEDYFLFLGRIIPSKGILDAVELTRVLGRKLIIAGPGDYEKTFGKKPPAHVEFVGMADLDKRAYLLSKTYCLLALTGYNEPCGYIVPEAGWSGTRVMTANTGGFTETVSPGVNGFRGDAFCDWVEDAEKLDTITPEMCRDHAEKHFSFAAVRPKYQAFWRRIDALHEADGAEYFTY